MTPDVQRLIVDLQVALGLQIVTGQITLNLADTRLQSVETKTYQRVAPKKIVDTQPRVAVN